MPEEITIHDEKILWVDTVRSSELEAGFQSRPFSELRRFEGMTPQDGFSFRGFSDRHETAYSTTILPGHVNDVRWIHPILVQGFAKAEDRML